MQSTNLYSQYAKEFSNSRQSHWPGWNEILEFIPNNPKILDLGCGNARFLKYLVNQKIKYCSYHGVDNSQEMLKLARTAVEGLKNVSFSLIDLNQKDWHVNIREKFDFVVAFGLFHHLNSNLARKNFFKNVETLLTSRGVFVVTFWMFQNDPRFSSKIIKELGNNDYILSFGQNGAERFVHLVSEPDIDNFTSFNSLSKIKQFYADGKLNNLNLYAVFSKKKNKI